MGTVNVQECSAFDIRHTRTTKDFVQVASMHSNSGITACVSSITTTIDMTAYDDLSIY
jgi:hypothetical protein